MALYWACAWAANVRTRARDAEALAARDAGHGRERGRAQGKRGVCHELQPSGFLEHRRCSPSIDSYCIDSYSLARGVPRHVLTCTAVNEIKKHPPLTLAISGSTWGHVGYEARAGGTDRHRLRGRRPCVTRTVLSSSLSCGGCSEDRRRVCAGKALRRRKGFQDDLRGRTRESACGELLESGTNATLASEW